MAKTVKDQIIEQLERLDAPQQTKVLDFARRLNGPMGTLGENLSRFAGCINPVDLEAMSRAIQEGCETVDPHAW